MTKRVIDDEDYAIILRGELAKCIKRCTKTPEQKAKEEEESNRFVAYLILGVIILGIFYFFLFMSTQHGFYMNDMGQYVQY